MAAPDMSGKVVVITGGNAGIGKETAVGVARTGARVVITARDERRGQAAWKEIRERTGSQDVDVMALDLASLASIRSFAADFRDRYDRLDVLVNNAGCLLSKRQETEDGFESTFGVNHLGHFLLTRLLLDVLTTSAPSRIVNVSSHAHKGARQGLDFDDLQSTRHYRPLPVYSKSKLANIYFTRALAPRVEQHGVTVNALHPGFVRSQFALGGDTGHFYSLGVRIASPFAISARRGARTSIYLASSPELVGVTGAYYFRCKPASISPAARDNDAARRLFDVSEELVESRPG
jgi:NAD(P)-dependent dehydrogenase (short-subunit alcohol dehydrogenase family)